MENYKEEYENENNDENNDISYEDFLNNEQEDFSDSSDRR